MAIPAAPTGPIWVATLDRREPSIPLAVDAHYAAARLLVTADGAPVGLVVVPLVAGQASAEAIGAAVTAQLGPDSPDVVTPPWSPEPLTVVVATRGRPESVRRCVRAVLAGNHPAVTVLVVDNDPPDDATERVVAQLRADARPGTVTPDVRYVREPRRGASIGRNRGLDEATTRIVAFTDDDTEVDPSWAGRIAGTFAVHPDLACLSGPVVGARLETAEERAAELGLVWNKGFTARRYSLVNPPAGSAIFPFSPGLYGIGANFAVHAGAARQVGGFDDALGPGTPTRGGEDGEFMVRLVLAGHVVAYEPAVLVWHHHRSSSHELHVQQSGYAVGLGAFLTKIALDRRAGVMALRRVPAVVAQLRHIEQRESDAGDGMPAASGVARARWMLSGGAAYVRGRRAARRAGGRVPALTPRVGVPTPPAQR